MYCVKKQGRIVALSAHYDLLSETWNAFDIEMLSDAENPLEGVPSLEVTTFIGPRQMATPNVFKVRPDLLKAGHWQR